MYGTTFNDQLQSVNVRYRVLGEYSLLSAAWCDEELIPRCHGCMFLGSGVDLWPDLTGYIKLTYELSDH